eukprot:jgi/Undpi1/3835/HiC_scaffold_16.g07204.m1
MGRRRAYVPGGFATAARLCRALTELPTGVGISDAVSFCFRKPANIARGAAPAPAVNERELRGGIFSVVGAGVNVTVRQRLFESLARQEIGFFDTMKTGDLMSRLAGDCTKIGDQVMNNVNVFLRNIVMVVVALLFMVILSWRLSLVAFTSVPAVVVISTWYDNYINEIAKSSQDKLAEAGAVAEQSLSSMNTVRSFAAEGRECKEYVVALVGPSGGGKSSCIALLENLYQPSTGQVMLDGIPVHEYNHHWLHQSVSIVGQEPTLYARSIRENIIYGLEGESTSGFLYDIDTAPAGRWCYETQAGERGVQMSGGQKQRIAIARALVRKPRVLLLDEATRCVSSLALDAESEHFVQQAIDDMIARGGMTVILIAHRLSTVKRADKICVIQEGKVEGTHGGSLPTKGGMYSVLTKLQLEIRDYGEREDIGSSTPARANDLKTGKNALS